DRVQVPQSHRLVGAAGRELPAVRGQRQGGDFFRVPEKRTGGLAGGHVEDAHRPGAAAGGERLAVAAVGQGIHGVGQLELLLLGAGAVGRLAVRPRGAVNLHGAVVATTGDRVAVGGKDDLVHLPRALVGRQAERLAALLGVRAVDVDPAFAVAGGEQ